VQETGCGEASCRSLGWWPPADHLQALALRPDLIYTPQFSNNLKNWAGGMTQVGGSLDNGDGTESVTFEVPGESHTTIFVRVVLELTSLP